MLQKENDLHQIAMPFAEGLLLCCLSFGPCFILWLENGQSQSIVSVSTATVSVEVPVALSFMTKKLTKFPLVKVSQALHGIYEGCVICIVCTCLG